MIRTGCPLPDGRGSVGRLRCPLPDGRGSDMPAIPGATGKRDGAEKSHNRTDVSGHPCPETALDKGFRICHFAVCKDFRLFSAPSSGRVKSISPSNSVSLPVQNVHSMTVVVRIGSVNGFSPSSLKLYQILDVPPGTTNFYTSALNGRIAPHGKLTSRTWADLIRKGIRGQFIIA